MKKYITSEDIGNYLSMDEINKMDEIIFDIGYRYHEKRIYGSDSEISDVIKDLKAYLISIGKEYLNIEVENMKLGVAYKFYI